MIASRIRFLVFGLTVAFIGAVLPSSAQADTTFSCNGGSISIDTDGLITGFGICTGALVFPEGAKTLSPYETFNSGVTSIKFPSTFNDFSRLAGGYFPELSSFTVAASNPNAATVDGVLYSKNLTKLLRFPPARTGTYKLLPDTLSVGSMAFLYSKLSSLDLGQSVTEIEWYGLYYMQELTKLELSPTLQIIGGDSFLSTPKLASITVPESNPNFKTLEGNLVSKDGTTLYLYPAGKTETKCTLPSSLKKISRASMAYVNCVSVDIPTTVEEIESYVFLGSNIQTLSLPAKIKTIGIDPTYGAQSLKEITLASSNDNFTVIDNVLYDKAVTQIYSFPIASPTTSYTLPNSVSKSLWALAQVNALTEIVTNNNSTYKDIDGVLFTFDGSELVAYPKGRANSFYFLPTGTRKIAYDAISSNALQTIIALEDTSLIDAGGLTIYNTAVGVKRIVDLDSSFRKESASDLANLRKQLDEAYVTQNRLYEEVNKNANVLNKSISSGFVQQISCINGTFSVDLSNTLFSTQGCTGELDIPNIVQEIGAYAFNSPDITTIKIPASVTKIGPYAFSGLRKLTSFVVDPKNENFVAIDGVLFDASKKKLIAYPAGKTATAYTVPTSVTSIGVQAFSFAPLKTITFSEGLENIAGEAFFNSEIEKISLPSSLMTIEIGAFTSMANLSEFSVSAANKYYAAKEGVLYTKNGQTFVKYPEGKSSTSYVIAAGTKAIGLDAFRSAPLKSLVIPEGIETIENNIFYGSTIANISLPSTITNLGIWSFDNMPNLESFLLSAENKSYKVIDGVLFSFDGTELIKVPSISPKVSYVVPSTVKNINGSAFAGSKFKELTIPSSVVRLESYVFYRTEVEKLNLPSTLESVDAYAFAGAYKLKEITIPTDAKSFATVEGVLYSKDLKTLIAIPTEKAISEFVVPKSVTKIGSYAITSSVIQKLTISESVNEISVNAFLDPFSLAEIVVDPANKSFKSIDGVLYNSSVTKLMHYPFAKKNVSFVMPDTVTTLDPDVYFYNSNLKSLQLSKSLYSLSTYQLLYLPNLTEVIYDGIGPQIHRGLFISTARLVTSSVVAAEKEAAATITGLKTDLKSAQDNKAASDASAKNALAAQAKAEADAKAAKEAQLKAEAETALALAAQAKAEADAKAAKEAQVKAEAETALALAAQAKAEADAKAAKEAQVKAEAESKAMADAKSASDAELASAKLALASASAELAKWKPITITCVKGKVTKKVTAVNAKCPTGYKKK